MPIAILRWRRAVAAALLLLACSPTGARAAFPGTNGPIVFEVNDPAAASDSDVWTANPEARTPPV